MPQQWMKREYFGCDFSFFVKTILPISEGGK
jgi:hypothetical protein